MWVALLLLWLQIAGSCYFLLCVFRIVLGSHDGHDTCCNPLLCLFVYDEVKWHSVRRHVAS